MSQPIATVPLTSRAPAARESNVKETIEQILIAFILAFIFRCFIVEAFVIPTGSMAPTLLGAHMNFRCPDCGWSWTVNYTGDSSDDVPAEATDIYHILCPNCGYKIPRVDAANPSNDATHPPVLFGDRILVQKYIYLAHEPNRWDVVVFKNPSPPSEGSERFQDNYIKRLTGLPNETLMVIDGDIYASQSTKPLEALTPDDFTVQTKPYKAQEAMWRIVYDNDYQPRGLPRTYPLAEPTTYAPNPPTVGMAPWRQPWTPSGKGWNSSGGRNFAFDDATGSAQLRFDRTAVPQINPLTDWLGYDITWPIYSGRRATTPNHDFFDPTRYPNYGELNDMSDVKLALTYRRTSGAGPLRLTLTKQSRAFTAEFTPGKVQLSVLAPGATVPTPLASAGIGSGDTHRIEFVDVDYRVSVRVDGDEVIATTPAQFHPDIPALLRDFEAGHSQEPAAITIEATAQKCSVEHVSLWRDVYYLNRDWGAYSKYYWAMPDNFPNGIGGRQLVRLGPDEFFTMGDNSMLSSDARCWTTPVQLPYENLDVQSGRVPRRFLLGHAFFVYWPAGYAPVQSVPFGFVPNFGEMRFIH